MSAKPVVHFQKFEGRRATTLHNRGEFFCVDHRAFFLACEFGLNAAIAYLVICRGAGSRSISSWSVHAIEKYTGMSRSKATSAIKRLIDNGLLEQIKSGSAPKYQIANLDREDCYFLPNSIVDGVRDETPPLALLRQAQDIPTLRLFLQLYWSNNLAAEGGVAREALVRRHKVKKLFERGAVSVWAFHVEGALKAGPDLYRPFTNRMARKAGLEHFWTALDLLERLGLIDFVPHVFESEDADAEVIHAYAVGKNGEQWEFEVGRAAHAAALRLLPNEFRHWEEADGWYLLPVPSHLRKLAVLGIARPRYRPKTSRTAAWLGLGAERAKAWIDRYQLIGTQASDLSAGRPNLNLQHKGRDRRRG